MGPELEQISVGAISNGRNLFALRVGRLSPSKIDRLTSDHLLGESRSLIASDEDLTDIVRSAVAVEATAQARRKLTPLELTTELTTRIIGIKINSAVAVLMDGRARRFPDRYVAAVDWIQGASETLSQVGLAYHTVRSGASEPIADAIGGLTDLPFPGPSIGEQAQTYVDLTQQAEEASRLLMKDPTGKSVVRGYRDHVMKQPVNIDARKGPITKFYLTGVDAGIQLYEMYYDKSAEELAKDQR